MHFFRLYSDYNLVFSYRIKTGFNCQDNKNVQCTSFIESDEESN